MGSVRRQSEAQSGGHDCNVALVGDCRTGKSALVARFVSGKFTEAYKATAFEKHTTTALVADARVKYTVWDTTGSHSASHNSARQLAYRDVDVFLLCYKISDPTTLFTALNFWCPEVRAIAPSTPIILVGCQADLRNDREQLSALAKEGKAPVSSEQALSFSQQIGAAMYVETCAKLSRKSASSPFEVAALASMGKLVSKSPRSTPSPKTIMKRISDCSPGNSLERSDLVQQEPAAQFWDKFQLIQSPPQSRSTLEYPAAKASPTGTNPSTGSLSSSRSVSLSTKTKSTTSIPSLTSSSLAPKTPRGSRKGLNKDKSDKMITIKCQRLTADKTYEEIEVEVPAPIYDTIQLYNDTGSLTARNVKERKSLSSKLKNLFYKK